MGEVEYVLTDSYGDGWNNNHLKIFIAGTDVLIADLFIPGQVNGTPNDNYAEGIVNLCYGVDYDLVWVAGSYPYETGFTLTAPMEASSMNSRALAAVVLFPRLAFSPPSKSIVLLARVPPTSQPPMSFITALPWLGLPVPRSKTCGRLLAVLANMIPTLLSPSPLTASPPLSSLALQRTRPTRFMFVRSALPRT